MELNLLGIKFIFVNKNRDIVNIIQKQFSDLMNVEILKCDIS